MNIEQAEQVADYMEYTMGVSVEVREAYSGRGMYGEEVPAFVYNPGDELAIGAAFEALGFDTEDAPRRFDSMGLRAIIY